MPSLASKLENFVLQLEREKKIIKKQEGREGIQGGRKKKEGTKVEGLG